MQAFFHGVFLAMGLILPLGIQNLFVFNQGTTQTVFMKALPAVITASVCDTLLIVMAVQGVSLVIASFAWFKVTLLSIGFVFLLYMGWLTWNSGIVGNREEKAEPFTAKQQIGFAATVSLLNPHAVLDTIGVIGTSSIQYEGQEKWLFTMACIIVSWCWFLFLAAMGRLIGQQKNFTGALVMLNKVSALFMWGSALYMAYSGIYL